jgi:hypothetical protein
MVSSPATTMKQLVGVLVGVPDELALDLHDLDLVVVESSHHLR